VTKIHFADDVIGTTRLVISVPRLVVGPPKLVASTYRYFETCYRHSLVRPRSSPDLLCPPRCFASASWCTRRSLHLPSMLLDLTTRGFWSDHFPRLPEASRRFQRQTYILLMQCYTLVWINVDRYLFNYLFDP